MGGLTATVEEIKSTRERVTASHLYDKIMFGELNQEEKYLLATAIKRIATKENISTNLLVFTPYSYWDLDDKEDETDF